MEPTPVREEALPTYFHKIKLPQDFPLIFEPHHRQKPFPIRHLHYHNCIEIGYCHSGCGVIAIGGNFFTFKEGDCVIISANVPHFAQTDSDRNTEWSWVYCDPAGLIAPEVNLSILAECARIFFARGNRTFTPERHPRITALAAEIANELERKAADYQLAFTLLVAQLTVQVKRLFKRERQHVEQTGLANTKAISRLSKAIEYICHNSSRNIKIEECAERCYMSPTNFRRLFKEAYGKSPQQYIAELRLSIAYSNLKNTDQSIALIADKSGFRTVSAFDKAFKKAFSKTPRDIKAEADSAA